MTAYKTKVCRYWKHFHVDLTCWPTRRWGVWPHRLDGLVQVTVQARHHSLTVSWSRVSYL